MTIDTKCRKVSVYAAGRHVNDLEFIDDVEMFVSEMAETYSNTGNLMIGGIDNFTTDYTLRPRLEFAIAEDHVAGYLAWEGTRGRSPVLPDVPADAIYFSDSLTSARRFGPEDMLVDFETIQLAVLEFVATGKQPTCVEWDTQSSSTAR